MTRFKLACAMGLILAAWSASGLAYELHCQECHGSRPASSDCNACFLIVSSGQATTPGSALALVDAGDVIAILPPAFTRVCSQTHHASAAARAPPTI